MSNRIPKDALNTQKSDLILSSLCQLLSNFAKSGIIGKDTEPCQVSDFMKIFELSLKRPEEHVLETASICFSSMAEAVKEEFLEIEKYIHGLDCSYPAPQRSGFALLLGYLPSSLIMRNLNPIVDALISASKLSPVKSQNFAECRRDAVLSLTRIINTEELNLATIHRILNCFIECMNDFSVEARGDVGSWIREVIFL